MNYIYIYIYIVQSTDTCFAVPQLISVKHKLKLNTKLGLWGHTHVQLLGVCMVPVYSRDVYLPLVFLNKFNKCCYTV